MANPDNYWKPGQSGNPKGRPKGTTNIHSKKSVKKLEALGHDPIEELHKMYLIAEEQGDVDTMFKINNRLIDFGYSKQPSVIEANVEQTVIPVLDIATKPDEDTKD